MAQYPLLRLNKSYYKEVIGEYEKRRNATYQKLQEIPDIVCKEPKGAFYIFIKMPIIDSSHFATWLLSDYQKDGSTIMVAPGDGFYAEGGLGNDEIRIAYVLKQENMIKGVELLKSGFETYRDKFKDKVK